MFHFPDFFKAVGHPIRQKIINILHDKNESMVKDLVSELNLSQSTVSHHLAILKKAGIVRAHEIGAESHYSICCDTISKCCSNFKNFFK